MGVDCRRQARRRRRARRREPRPRAVSTTMRASRESKSSTAIRCAFGLRVPTSILPTCWRCRRLRRSRAKWSRRTATISARIPVGTGPYRLVEYKRSSRIVLEANAGYRGEVFAEQPSDDPADTAIARHLAGKTLPLIGRIEISVIVEEQSRWLAFLDRQLDYMQQLPPSFADQALQDGKLRPEFAARAIRQEAAGPSEHLVELFQHGGSGRRWLYAGQDRVATRHGHGLQHRGIHPRDLPRAGAPGTEPIAAGHRGVRSEAARRSRRSTTRRRLGRCSTSSASRIATVTDIGNCPTASRS